ncbi:hypothetical protein [Streptomyces sp. TR06-5]
MSEWDVRYAGRRPGAPPERSGAVRCRIVGRLRRHDRAGAAHAVGA